MRVYFSYHEQALRITALIDHHEGHEVSATNSPNCVLASKMHKVVLSPPRTPTSTLLSSGVRCRCGLEHEDEEMIECSRCSQRQHTFCATGLPFAPATTQAEEYLCYLCRPTTMSYSEELARFVQTELFGHPPHTGTAQQQATQPPRPIGSPQARVVIKVGEPITTDESGHFKVPALPARAKRIRSTNTCFSGQIWRRRRVVRSAMAAEILYREGVAKYEREPVLFACFL